MDIVTPGIGLIFWTALLFSLVLVVLRKFAYKPILQTVKAREDSIKEALSSSTKAKDEVEALKKDIEEMKQTARAEREIILKEAKDSAGKIITESQDAARKEYERIVASAQEDIRNEKKAALAEVKNQVAKFSVEIAEKLLRKELSDEDYQKKLINELLDETKLN
ncbi:F0F1 ATP synthase subunit B [Chondrinema litorale]|uniref:F0F1 ATP synthase subunit B n=1 Tax=Chondrinema litorale TaxID=2994555 RepID=UPI002543A791|nr:F0F1 ATP synthase subunit B [Chondrinema litorale]UZR95045.1 F0F1 ATP synthase subunit B [Chondrinema litorale]